MIKITKKPSQYDVARRTAARRGMPRRSSSDEVRTPEDALLWSLVEDGDMVEVGEIPLSLRSSPTTRTVQADEQPLDETSLGFEVEIGEDENAVVLIEEDGRFAWHFPTSIAPSNRARGSRRTVRRAHRESAAG